MRNVAWGGASAQSAGSSASSPVFCSASKKAPAPEARAHSSKLSDSASAATAIAASAPSMASERSASAPVASDGRRTRASCASSEVSSVKRSHASVISAMLIIVMGLYQAFFSLIGMVNESEWSSSRDFTCS